MQHHTGNMILLSQETGRTRPDTPAKQDDLVSWYLNYFCQVEIHCLNVIVKTLLFRYVTVGFPESSVLVNHSIDIHMLQEVRLEPRLNQVDVFGVPV